MASDEQIPYNFPKRLTDIFISLCVLAIFLPIIVLILTGIVVCFALQLEDRGPILYKEVRYSKGKRFNILKFRVLRKGILAHASNLEHCARLYEKDTENLTFIGQFLKKWYLDEIPQIINILKGNMSIVGPRPWSEDHYNNQLKRGICYRKYVMAGWTGLGQLCKRSMHKDKITMLSEEADISYVNRCRNSGSLSLCFFDIKIIFKTFYTMLEGKGLND